MCERCDGFSERFRVNTGYEYRALVRQLHELVLQNTFKLVRGTYPLEDVLNSPTWPGNSIYHLFECAQCSRRFQLGVETYDGSGGAWEMVISDSPSSQPS
jgi:hypothetical protein